jgi:hypothetical protein
MALRDNPYLPLYIQDFLTDEKLIECSAQSTGVYIRLMCIMHKSEHYGKILLKQKDKQSSEQVKNFALKVAKQMPYTEVVVESSLIELLSEKVLYIDGDYLVQRRMVRDCEISTKRALAGREGGKKTSSATDFATANVKANADNENDIDIDNDSDNKTVFESDSKSDMNTSSENSNSSDLKKDVSKRKEKNVPEFAIELAKYLKEKIVESGTDMVLKESHLTGWANDFRLMVTSDKKTVEDIRKKIDDIFMNEFWSKQIRSAGKLREQWNAGKLDNLKQRTAAGHQQTNEAEEVDRYASEKRYDSGRCRRYIDAMLRRLFPGDKWEEYIIPETDAELKPIWEIIVADGGYINGVKTKEAALKIVGMLRKYS